MTAWTRESLAVIDLKTETGQPSIGGTYLYLDDNIFCPACQKEL